MEQINKQFYNCKIYIMIIIIIIIIYYYRFYSDASGLKYWLSVYNETFFLFLTLTRELYKLGTNDDALLLINSSVLCRFRNSQLKMTNQPSGELQSGLYFLDYTHMYGLHNIITSVQLQIPVVSQMEDAVTCVCWVLWIQEATPVTALKEWYLETTLPTASSKMEQL